jgi:type II secretory pathway component GspD/PulD (secretin)
VHGGILARIAAVVWLSAIAPSLSAQQMQVIELRHATAAQVIPVLEPLLDPGDAITGTDGTLFVRAGPDALARVQQALDVLDRAPRELVITVAQGNSIEASAAAARGSVVISDDSAAARVVVRADGGQVRLDNLSSVRTIEGMEAWIATGRSVPYTDVWRTPGPGGTVQRSTTYRDVDTGFYALPRLRGDVVSIEISARQQALAPGQRQDVRTAGTNTVIEVPIGTWVEIGAVRESGGGSDEGLLRWGRYTSASEYSAWLRVDPAR